MKSFRSNAFLICPSRAHPRVWRGDHVCKFKEPACCLATTMHSKFPTEYHGHHPRVPNMWPFCKFRIFSCVFFRYRAGGSHEKLSFRRSAHQCFLTCFQFLSCVLSHCFLWLFGGYAGECKSGPEVWYVVEVSSGTQHDNFAAQCWQASSMSRRPWTPGFFLCFEFILKIPLRTLKVLLGHACWAHSGKPHGGSLILEKN